jgi:hypothetical protein
MRSPSITPPKGELFNIRENGRMPPTGPADQPMSQVSGRMTRRMVDRVPYVRFAVNLNRFG